MARSVTDATTGIWWPFSAKLSAFDAALGRPVISDRVRIISAPLVMTLFCGMGLAIIEFVCGMTRGGLGGPNIGPN